MEGKLTIYNGYIRDKVSLNIAKQLIPTQGNAIACVDFANEELEKEFTKYHTNPTIIIHEGMHHIVMYYWLIHIGKDVDKVNKRIELSDTCNITLTNSNAQVIYDVSTNMIDGFVNILDKVHNMFTATDDIKPNIIEQTFACLYLARYYDRTVGFSRDIGTVEYLEAHPDVEVSTDVEDLLIDMEIFWAFSAEISNKFSKEFEIFLLKIGEDAKNIKRRRSSYADAERILSTSYYSMLICQLKELFKNKPPLEQTNKFATKRIQME
jgi:hypothetical protein